MEISKQEFDDACRPQCHLLRLLKLWNKEMSGWFIFIGFMLWGLQLHQFCIETGNNKFNKDSN